MRSVPVVAREEVDLDRLSELTGLGELRTLGDVLSWLRAQTPPRTVDEIVTQDEYTHDVVLPFDDHSWLVYDTT